MSILKFEKVSKKYPYEKEFLLKDISFELSAGESVGIVAEKQSGKSSIVKMIAGLTKPTDGKILLYGKPLDECDMSTCNVGAVFDDFALMKGKTVLKNICYPLKIRKTENFLQVAQTAVNNFNLNDVANVKAKKLTETDKLKTALARLSTRKLDLLIFDDIYRNIDRTDAIEYINRLIQKDAAVLFLSSQTIDLQNCKRVYVFANGSTVFCGSCGEAEEYIKESKCFDKYDINKDMQNLLQKNK